MFLKKDQGKSPNQDNFRCDVAVSGVINIADVIRVGINVDDSATISVIRWAMAP